MRALTQVIGTGECRVVEVPPPGPRGGSVLVRSRASLISTGTETMMLQFGRAGLLKKARSQPDRVKQVVEKAASEGIGPTLAAVRDKLSDTISPGYCQSGVVIEAGGRDSPFGPGDRVVTNGPHAEIVRVPHQLAAKVPEGVSFETAAFTPLAAIALNGLRLANPTIGETLVVFGLGLVGQLTVQLVRANGCRCIGIDTNPVRVALAESFGAIGIVAEGMSIVERVRELTWGVGADAVLMTLASSSDDPMHQAAGMSRKRGRVVLVGVTGLNLRRDDFYEKELSFQVSCSYGPGRYDPGYEERGHDYPLPYVRWTEQRNFRAVLDLMAAGKLATDSLVTHRYQIDEAAAAYDVLLDGEPSLGVLLTYEAGEAGDTISRTLQIRDAPALAPGKGVLGVIGAGGYARRTLLPAARAAGFEVRTIVSSSGVSAGVEGERFEASFVSSDVQAVLEDSAIDTVFILTRHNSHADLATRALEAGKHVFVEKPLALDLEGLDQVRSALAGSRRFLMVGFNRRFAPLAREMKALVEDRAGPVSLILTVNAGRIEGDHWTQDPKQGGGRIVGEACHFVDLARYLAGAPIVALNATSASDRTGRPLDDISHIALRFANGSTGVINYLANGASRFGKERVEAFFDGKTVAIDNWRRLRTWGLSRRDRLFPRRIDKGHDAEMERLIEALRSGSGSPIPADELFEVSEWSIRAAEAARRISRVDG